MKRILSAGLGLMLGLTAAAGSGQAQEQAEKAAFVHLMVSFTTPPISGRWDGWNHCNSKVTHNPDLVKENGQHDIASTYYPVIGPYDMTDPELVEYHCQLLRMAGLDGAVFDLGFFIEPNTTDRQKANFAMRSVQLYIQYFKKYHLKGVVLFEDKANWIWNNKLKTREETVAAAVDDLDNWFGFFREVQYMYDDRPLLLVFSYEQEITGRGQGRLLAEELNQWKSRFPKRDRPLILANRYHADYYGVHDGVFQWPEIIGQPPPGSDYTLYNNLETERRLWKIKDQDIQQSLKQGEFRLACGTVWPGWDDAGCMAWGSGHKAIPREQGALYTYHWQRVLRQKYPLVLIATWNDWFEGMNIEPAVEFGYIYLELTRTFVSQWKGRPFIPGNMAVAEWIYKIRKNPGRNSGALHAADNACRAIQNGNYQQAEELLLPYVQMQAEETGTFAK